MPFEGMASVNAMMKWTASAMTSVQRELTSIQKRKPL